MYSELCLPEIGSYLGCLCTMWWLFTNYLGVSSPSKWCDSLFHKDLLISSPFCFSFIFLTPFFHTFSHLCLAFFNIICFFSCPLYPHLHHHNHHICVFFFPLKVNIHTYLTTWLSSCLVEIFFGFLTIFCLKQKNHKQNATHKMCNLKTNLHHMVIRARF